jgi:hypothetical protein
LVITKLSPAFTRAMYEASDALSLAIETSFMRPPVPFRVL